MSFSVTPSGISADDESVDNYEESVPESVVDEEARLKKKHKRDKKKEAKKKKKKEKEERVDSEESEEERPQKKSRKEKQGAARFIDMEVEVDDEEEEEYEDEEEAMAAELLGQEMNQRVSLRNKMFSESNSRFHEYAAAHAGDGDEEEEPSGPSMDPRHLADMEEVRQRAKEIEARYKIIQDNTEDVFGDADVTGAPSSMIQQQSLLPTVRDPKLFMVKCLAGI